MAKSKDKEKIEKLQKEIQRLQAELKKEKEKVEKAKLGEGENPTKVGKDSSKTKSGTRKVGKGSKKLTDNIQINIKEEATPKYSLIKEIKASPFYGKKDRDPIARKWIEDNCPSYPRNQFLQGQMILFNYFDPKFKDTLEYYDASPCTIFFNVVNTKEGKRVLGFNIHYYPPQIRYQILNKIFELYRGIYIKYFKAFNKRELDGFEYQIIIKELEKLNLGFGVRMYIPELIGNPRIITANKWQVAVFTEGWFKKRTRTQIMAFWRAWDPRKSKKNQAKAVAKETKKLSKKK